MINNLDLIFFLIIFCFRLYSRDKHQLFELLCIQLRCIAIAYSEGLNDMIKTNPKEDNPICNPIQLLECKIDAI